MKLNRQGFQIALAKKSMNQCDLAKKSGFSIPLVSKAARGEDISTKAVGQLALALGCQVEDIIERREG